jgi:excisionase family DNA binding protein
MSNQIESLYTVEELADHWRVSTRTIRRLIEKKQLAVVRIGRRVVIRGSSVEAVEAAGSTNKVGTGG